MKNQLQTFFKNNVASIEVVIDNEIDTIFFPKLPVCQFISELSKFNFEESVDRENYVSKISGLMQEVP